MRKKIAICFIFLFLTAGFFCFAPIFLQADYNSNSKIYEGCVLKEEDFKVYRTSILGKHKEVKKFSLKTDIAEDNFVIIETKYGKVKAELNFVKIKERVLEYPKKVKKEKGLDKSKIKEITYYEDGKRLTTRDEDMEIHILKEEKYYKVSVKTKFNKYQVNVEIT